MPTGFLYRWETIELHDKRHREIVSIVQAIKRLERNASTLISRRKRSRKGNRVPSEQPYFDRKPTAIDREQQGAEWDNRSSTLNHEDDGDEDQPRDDAGVRKATKAQRKAERNQVRFDVITNDDLARVQAALHPEISLTSEDLGQGQGLYDNATIDKNIAFNANTFRYGTLRKGVHAKRLLKNNGPKRKGDAACFEHIEELSTSILEALGVRTKLTKMSKEQRNLDAKLRAAIKNDLVAFENDQAETMERMAGYWRYANKRTYNQMVENNELWDWATGQKLMKVEEAELDVVDEEDETADEETLAGETASSSPITSPERLGDAKEFDFPANEDGLKTPTKATSSRLNKDSVAAAELARHIAKLSFSPGHSPGPTLRFSVPSPSSSDDNPYDGPWDDCDTPINNAVSPNQDLFTPEDSVATPVTMIVRQPHLYANKEDNRTNTTAHFVRNASPPRDEPSPTIGLPAAAPRWRRLKVPRPSTIPPNFQDIPNRFGNLEREIAAPCDDPKDPDTVLTAAIGGKIINIAKPVEIDDGLVGVEEGWQVAGGAKKKRDFPVVKGKGGKKGNAGGGEKRR
ncbi:hypothetical protein ACLMJK_003395 [Lecanora helva]